MSCYQSLKHKAKNAAVIVGGVATSGVVMAADHSTAIAAAGADGETNLGAAVLAILGVVAVVVGVGMVISFLRKS